MARQHHTFSGFSGSTEHFRRPLWLANMFHFQSFTTSIQYLQGHCGWATQLERHHGWATQHLEGQCGWATCFTFQGLQDQHSI